MSRCSSILTCGALLLALAATPSAVARRIEFALIGDMPYTPDQITNYFPKLIQELNKQKKLAFIVHDGDIKAGNTPCHDAELLERQRDFNSFKHPFVLVFGDNEWTDCGRGGYEPEERLQKLRELFTQGDESLGRKRIKLCRQSCDPNFSQYRENVRWVAGNVLFVGLNVPGGINNFGKPEFAARNEANISWLRDSFAVANREKRRALMLIFQANPFPERGSTNKVHQGFKEMLQVLERETLHFGKPVVLVHGDSHHFRIDKPLVNAASKRRIENFTRVETFGNPDVHWLSVTIDPDDPGVFTFRQRIIAANKVKHVAP